MLRDSRARALVVSARAAAESSRRCSSRLPQLEHVIVSGEPRRGASRAFASLLDASPRPLRRGPHHRGRRLLLALLLGLDRLPEGHHPRARQPHPDRRALRASVLGIEEDDLVFSAAKLFFAYGLGNALTFPMAVGATAAADGGAAHAGRGLPAACGSTGPTIFYGVPTLYAGHAREPRPAPARTSCACAAASPPAKRCPRRSGGAGRRASASTSSTASAAPSCCTSSSPTVPGTCATGPAAGRTRLRAPPGGRERRAGRRPASRASCRSAGPRARRCYWNNREKTRATFQGAWTRSGDKYAQDADGYYVYAGRSDDMLKVSGMYVSPVEVEVGAGHPRGRAGSGGGGPRGRGPAGQADGLRGAQARSTAPRAELVEELKQHVKSRLAPFKYPRCDGVPRGAAEDRDREDPALQAARATEAALGGSSFPHVHFSAPRLE